MLCKICSSFCIRLAKYASEAGSRVFSMLDFADVFKIAPTLQQMQIPALSEAPQIRLLRLAEPNCKKQQAAGPSGFKTPLSGKAQPNAEEQEQGPPTQGGLCPPRPNRATQRPQGTPTPASYGKNNLCAMSLRLRRDKSPPLCIPSTPSTGAGADLGPIACREYQEERNRTFLFSA